MAKGDRNLWRSNENRETRLRDPNLEARIAEAAVRRATRRYRQVPFPPAKVNVRDCVRGVSAETSSRGPVGSACFTAGC
ncbi:hypothetical protein NL676_039168 [Syzygium grande]|nr:hypothetical protein NL676_039168 [Syzygium grande]